MSSSVQLRRPKISVTAPRVNIGRPRSWTEFSNSLQVFTPAAVFDEKDGKTFQARKGPPSSYRKVRPLSASCLDDKFPEPPAVNYTSLLTPNPWRYDASHATKDEVERNIFDANAPEANFENSESSDAELKRISFSSDSEIAWSSSVSQTEKAETKSETAGFDHGPKTAPPVVQPVTGMEFFPDDDVLHFEESPVAKFDRRAIVPSPLKSCYSPAPAYDDLVDYSDFENSSVEDNSTPDSNIQANVDIPTSSQSSAVKKRALPETGGDIDFEQVLKRFKQSKEEHLDSVKWIYEDSRKKIHDLLQKLRETMSENGYLEWYPRVR